MFSQQGRRQELIRWAVGITAGLSLAGVERARALEADQLLSHNFGRFLVQPQLDLSAQFTGNLFYASQDPEPGGFVPIEVPGIDEPVFVATPAGSAVESDLLWYLSPGVEVQYGLNPENSLTLTYFHDTILYTDHSDFNAGQNRLQFDARAQFGRFTLIGNDNIQWLDTILGGSTAVVRRTPIKRQVWTDYYRLTYDATMKTDFYTTFNHDLNDYSNNTPPINLYNQSTLRGSLGATYKPSERLGIFAEAGVGHTDVSANLPPALQRPGDDSYVYGGFVGVRGNFTARVDGTVKVGYETRDFPGVENAANGGAPAVGMALNYTPSVKLFLNLAYDRRVGVSSQYANQAYTYNTFSLTANQLVGTTGKWILRGRVGFNLGDFSISESTGRGLVVTPDGPETVLFPITNARNDSTYTGSIGVIYQPRGWLSSSLTYSYEKYSADFADQYVALTSGLNDFYVNRVVLQVTIGY